MTVLTLTKDKMIIRLTGLILMSAFLFTARLYNPSESDFFTCRFKNLTGYDCPTCGLSRSVHSILTLNIYDSIKYNPLGCMLIVGLLVFLAKFLVELLLRKEIIIRMIKPYGRVLWVALLLMVFSSWILRLLGI